MVTASQKADQINGVINRVENIADSGADLTKHVAEKKLAQKTATKTVGKTVTKTATKSLLKKIPGVSAIAGVAYAFECSKKKDWVGAGLEITSGVAGCVPGIGTGISIVCDSALLAKDVMEIHKDQNESQLSSQTPFQQPKQSLQKSQEQQNCL